ncbi:hypothetical protein OWF29_003946 [Salmonella enterica subsp. enterica serovar Bredeney]|nr:hypothetical protein [Salmonella enterica subsp. enterica]EJQ8847050.1 hypothetical protein [Salmonella enterica]EKE6652692.1 hypothetical protein [Salmonella enterica subsp. enterica serovar Bredeney]
MRDYSQLSTQELTVRLERVQDIHKKVTFAARDGSPRSLQGMSLAALFMSGVWILSDNLLLSGATCLLVYGVVMLYSRAPADWQELLDRLLSRLEPLQSSPLRWLRTDRVSWSYAERRLQQEMALILSALRHPSDCLNA